MVVILQYFHYLDSKNYSVGQGEYLLASPNTGQLEELSLTITTVIPQCILQCCQAIGEMRHTAFSRAIDGGREVTDRNHLGPTKGNLTQVDQKNK